MSRRSSARERARARPGGAGHVPQLPVQEFRNPYPPFEIASAEQIETVHAASLRVLAEVGVNFLLPQAREILKAAGAGVREGDTRVRFDPALVEQAMASVPASFRLHARNPARSLTIGGDHIVFATVSSPPNASDIEGGRRPGCYADFCDFLRLTQMVNVAQLIPGHAVEPIDIPTPVRHLDATLAMIELCDKPFRLYSLGRQRVLDVLEMVKLARGIDDATLEREPSVFTIVNANSPLQYDVPMLWGMIELARRLQPVIVTPFTLAGAMAPVTVAGALVQQNAEALAGMAFVQLVRPGAPVVYGGFTSNVDMKTGSPAFGTPEYAKATLVGTQLARRYRVPYRSSNVNASNAPDAQATWESQMSLWSSVIGGAHIIHHGLGWLEGGLCASFEKFVMDAEMVQMMAEMLRPLDFSGDELGLDAIRDVGPGGHYFGTPHTLARFEHAFYRPMLADWRNFETWQEAGALDATRRAHALYKQLLAEYRQPALDPAARDALHAFVTRRKAEGGVPIN